MTRGRSRQTHFAASRLRWWFRCALVLALADINGALAQSESTWSNQGMVYLLGPTLDGTAGAGPIDTDVDMSTSDTFDTIDKGFLGMYRGEGEHWGVLLDVVYMDLKADAEGSRGVLSGALDLEQTLAIASLTYRVSDSLQVMGGALYADVSTELVITGPGDRVNQASVGEDWVDPIVGVLYETPIGSSWLFSGSAQVGGFGVSSDLVMVLGGAFSYRFNHWASLSLGYRYLDFDYEDGDGADRFKFDMKEHGPLIGFRFDF